MPGAEQSRNACRAPLKALSSMDTIAGETNAALRRLLSPRKRSVRQPPIRLADCYGRTRVSRSRFLKPCLDPKRADQAGNDRKEQAADRFAVKTPEGAPCLRSLATVRML